MKIINAIFGIPLGYLMWLCYILVNNYGVAIILFTFISKIILFPLSLLVQKNSIAMAKIKPQLDEISQRYAGDKDKIAEEQINLYDNEKYSPAMGCLPTLIQIPIIFGLINVIYNPLKHLLHIDVSAIRLLTAKTAQILGMEQIGASFQLKIVEILQNPDLLLQYEALRGQIVDYDQIISQIHDLRLTFCGINLSSIPSILQPDLLWAIPVFSGLSCLIMCVVQNEINVLQREQTALSKWGMSVFLIAFSVYFTFILPAGVGLYWICGNFFSVLVMFLVNWIYDPKKYIDYSKRPIKVMLTKEEKKTQKQKIKENNQRQNIDNKRFYSESEDSKQVVFYSMKSGFYKYFEAIIDYISEQSDIIIHYVTSDPDDAIFKKENPQILPYYIGEKALIPFMMKMDADIVVMTMPDLEKFHIKRSLTRKDIEYIYTFHGVASVHMVLREGALDNYDTIFCVGQHQIDEIRATEHIYELSEKKLIPCGYGLIDKLIAQYQESKTAIVKNIVIAPSWQQYNIMESCLDELLSGIINKGYRIILRPHPEFIKRFPSYMYMIMEKYGQKQDDYFIIDTDFSSNNSVLCSDLLITDWSTIAHEFSYTTKKPSLFINTPMKIMNPNYERISIVPLDISLRNEIGKSIDIDKIEEAFDTIQYLLNNQEMYNEKISKLMDRYVFNHGRAGEVAGRYIIDSLNSKKTIREECD